MPSLSLFFIETIIYDSSYMSAEFLLHCLIFRRWLDVHIAVSNTWVLKLNCLYDATLV